MRSGRFRGLQTRFWKLPATIPQTTYPEIVSCCFVGFKLEPNDWARTTSVCAIPEAGCGFPDRSSGFTDKDQIVTPEHLLRPEPGGRQAGSQDNRSTKLMQNYAALSARVFAVSEICVRTTSACFSSSSVFSRRSACCVCPRISANVRTVP